MKKVKPKNKNEKSMWETINIVYAIVLVIFILVMLLNFIYNRNYFYGISATLAGFVLYVFWIVTKIE